MGTCSKKGVCIFLWGFFVLLMIACNPSRLENVPKKEILTPTVTFPPITPLSTSRVTDAPQFSPTATVTSPTKPTSTPWPTVDPTLYATLYVTPTFTFTPTPNYYASMKSLYLQMIGEWWGRMGVTVNRQGRKAFYVVVVLNPQCEMGQICGRYHFDDGCFGELVLDNWRPTFLVFRNLEYSGKTNCPKWRTINVAPLKNERLSFSFSYRNEEGKRVNKSVVLRRK